VAEGTVTDGDEAGQHGQATSDHAQPDGQTDEPTTGVPDSRTGQAQHHDRRPADQVEPDAAEQPDAAPKTAPPRCGPVCGVSTFHDILNCDGRRRPSEQDRLDRTILQPRIP
jgi:hypothetical protein